MRMLVLAAAGSFLFLPSPVRSADPPPVPAPSKGLSAMPPPGPDDAPVADDEPVPPGSAADQELWRATSEVSNRIQLQRIAANKLQWEIRATRPDEQLRVAATAASPEEAKRLEALRGRLQTAWVRNYQFLVDRWPVDPTRGCHYPRLFLASSMQATEGPDKGPQLAQAREEARRCLELAQGAVGVLEASTRELRAVLAETERALPRAPVKAAAAAATVGGSPPAPAPARAKD